MLFNSLDFILFFLAVYGLYLCLPFRAQNRMLLAASYLFYGCWDWRFLGLIWLSSTLDFFAAQAIRDGDDERTRRSWLALSVAVNLGILFVFKYYGFFADSLQGLAAQFGLPLDAPTLHVVLPVIASLDPLFSIVVGRTVFDERLHATPAEVVLEVVGLTLLLLGVIRLSRSKPVLPETVSPPVVLPAFSPLPLPEGLSVVPSAVLSPAVGFLPPPLPFLFRMVSACCSLSGSGLSSLSVWSITSWISPSASKRSV